MSKSSPTPEGDLPSHPMLLPYLFHFRSQYGPVFVMAPERNIQWRLPDALARVVERLLSLIDGQRTIPQLVESVKADFPDSRPEMVVATMEFLRDHDLLIEGAAAPSPELSEPALARWGRNLSYFSGFERPKRSRFDYQLALQCASVAVIGLGGIGSWVAYNLAMAGVGRMVGVDGDVIALNNLNRQMLYRPGDVGKRKAEVAAETLAGIAPSMAFTGIERKLESVEDIGRVIDGCDLVVLAADQPTGLLVSWTNSACFAKRIPFMECGLQTWRALAGPLYVPGLTGCWACDDAVKRRQSKYYVETFDRLAERKATGQPSIATMCSIDGGIMAHEALKYLAGYARPSILGRELSLDTVNMRIRWRAIAKRPDCPTCQPVPPSEMPPRSRDLPQSEGRWSRWRRWLRA